MSRTFDRALSLVTLPDGCCRLVYSSTTQLLLQPFNGNSLYINGLSQQIPAAGVTLAPTGLAAATLYYVYAYMSGSVMLLQASTTAYTADAFGRKNMTGDATKRLVGMVYCQTAATFADTAAYRGVASYFNRQDRAAIITNSSNPGTGGQGSPVGVAAGPRFLVWADDNAPLLSISGITYNTTTGGAGYSYLYLDAANTGVTEIYNSPAVNYYLNMTMVAAIAVTEGFHYFDLYGYVSGGISYWPYLCLSTAVRI